jgi:hypothetical protein
MLSCLSNLSIVPPRFRSRFLRTTSISIFSAITILVLSASLPLRAQDPGKPQSIPSSSADAKPPKPPALVDPAGPTISVQTSEAMFDIGVALNACGYDSELDKSDPIRQKVRDQVNHLLQQSSAGQDARDKVCAYINQHRLADSTRDLAQYVSLALYLTPPPELAPSVELTEMPPDSTQVVGILPVLKEFTNAIQLHLLWVADRPTYEEEVNQLHNPLTQMVVLTNTYLKTPVATGGGSRFLVVLEPLLAPGQTNARVYGSDYVVVASPVNGQIHMREVRHTYLHYVIEPLLYSRASSMDRMLPMLKVVRDAPLEYTYRSDIVSLVIECMIRAIEARTMDTEIPEFKTTVDFRSPDAAKVDRERNTYLQKVAAVKQRAVTDSMVQGYVMTQYFYDAFGSFEKSPVSLKDSIGEMVYGMDVDTETRRAKQIEFAQEGSSDVIRRTPRQLRGLDLAEMKLLKGDADGAGSMAQQALDQHTGDPAFANFILARADLMHGHMDEAAHAFGETVKLSKDPRTMAWSHIYLGRIADVKGERDGALAEYRAALTVRDGQQDTKEAAQKGIKQPFQLPHQAQDDQDDDDSTAPPPAGKVPAPPASQTSAPHL